MLLAIKEFLVALRETKNSFAPEGKTVKPVHQAANEPLEPHNIDDVCDEVIGVIVSASKVQVGNRRGRPYEAFALVILAKDGEKYFYGMDLAEKFAKNEFKVGDKIHLKKYTTIFDVVHMGKKTTRKRNSYEITVLNKR